jgi:hypothetical protein
LYQRQDGRHASKRPDNAKGQHDRACASGLPHRLRFYGAHSKNPVGGKIRFLVAFIVIRRDAVGSIVQGAS